MNKRKVVVTGVGLVTPVGIGVKESWKNIVEGLSGISNITNFDTNSFSTPFSSTIAGEVKNFDPIDYLNTKDARRMDTFIQFGLVAALEAFNDSGLEVDEANADRIGTSIGSGIGGVNLIENQVKLLRTGGPRKISPFFVPGAIINMVAGNLSIILGLKGPNISIVTACTSGTHSIGDASRIIEYGDADVMVAGGAEATITPLTVAGFSSAKALSTRNDDPKTASRPWDADRDGFVIGEGAGVMVLEEMEHAKKRGAKIYCELSGFGMSADAYHITAPTVDGPKRSMLTALKHAEINKNEIDYINAHGTSTLLGDDIELNAIMKFTNQNKKLKVSSTKSSIGHLLGAAGSVEAIFSILSINNNIIPATLNLDDPIDSKNVNLVSNSPLNEKLDIALSNSFGFGGTNTALLFKSI